MTDLFLTDSASTFDQKSPQMAVPGFRDASSIDIISTGGFARR